MVIELNSTEFSNNNVPATELLYKLGIIKGHAELRRLIAFNAIRVNDESITKIDQTIDILTNKNIIVKVGKRTKVELNII